MAGDPGGRAGLARVRNWSRWGGSFDGTSRLHWRPAGAVMCSIEFRPITGGIHDSLPTLSKSGCRIALISVSYPFALVLG